MMFGFEMQFHMPLKWILFLSKEAQELEMKDAPYIPVRVIENLAAVGKNVTGFSISPSGYLEINDVSIK